MSFLFYLFISFPGVHPPILCQIFPLDIKCIQATILLLGITLSRLLLCITYHTTFPFVTFSVQLLLAKILSHHISHVAIHFSSPFSIVQVSGPYVVTGQTYVFITRFSLIPVTYSLLLVMCDSL